MKIKEAYSRINQRLLEDNNYICVGSKHKGDYVNVHDILYVEAYESYSWLHLRNGKKLLSCKSLKHYGDELNTSRFARIHRSYLVNLSFVKAYEKRYRLLHLQGNITLSVSCRKNCSFSEMIANIDY